MKKLEKEDWINTYQSLPYTYLLTHIPTGLKYYGVRFAKKCHPSEFWKTYKTSSKTVAKLITEYGDSTFKYEIRKTFESSEKARLWETKVLRRLKVTSRNDFLNKTDNISIQPLYGDDNPSRRLEVREKIRKSRLLWLSRNINPNIGRVTPDYVKEKQSIRKRGAGNPFFGKHHTDQTKFILSKNQTGSNNTFFGKKHSTETKARMSKMRLGKVKEKISCIFCNKTGAAHVMSRWHFNNCKELK